MKYELDGKEIALRPLSDVEYDLASRLARSLDICPTCGGRNEIKPGGVKAWVSRSYRYHGEEFACQCEIQLALYARYLLANIGDQYMRLNWDDFDGTEEADRWVKYFLDRWQTFLVNGMGLMFSSPTQGVGKTWAATHIGKELIKQRQKVYFLDFVQMVDAFCDRDEKRMIEQRMRETTFLILDDIVTGWSERQTELYALKFEVLIRHRTNYNLPTIATTNLTEKIFESEFPRIYSLLAPKQIWVKMNGDDYRKDGQLGIENEELLANREVRPIK